MIVLYVMQKSNPYTKERHTLSAQCLDPSYNRADRVSISLTVSTGATAVRVAISVKVTTAVVAVETTLEKAEVVVVVVMDWI
jgi:hypothetical protein